MSGGCEFSYLFGAFKLLEFEILGLEVFSSFGGHL